MHNLKHLSVWIRLIIEANFYISLIIFIVGCASSLIDDYTLFEFNTDIYGELANNLRIMMAYLALSEILVFGFCAFTGQYHYFLLVGFFLISVVPGLVFYGVVNNVEIDPDLSVFFLYCGVSQLLRGALSKIKPKPVET